jgi:dihydroxycyclohexadiene carboxylate dehydrogenase
MRFQGRIFAITGAAQGIGRRVAERAALEGAHVAVIDRSPIGAEVAESLRATGAQAAYIPADLETWAGCETAMAQAADVFGGIDVLVNNVGGTIWAKPFEYYEPDQIEAEIRRSLFPTLYGCRAVLPHMLDAGKGVIVNVSSIATRSLNRVPYAAAKGGVNAITASLAWEVAERGIRVVATAPGGTEAPPRAVPRNPNEQTAQEKVWYSQIVDQTIFPA